MDMILGGIISKQVDLIFSSICYLYTLGLPHMLLVHRGNTNLYLQHM